MTLAGRPLWEWALVINLASTGVMIGIIWFVQVVHYPLMAKVGAAAYPEYQRWHTRLTTAVVAPPMLLEAGTGALLLYAPPPVVSPAQLWLGFALILLLWAMTGLVMVPLHGRLERGFDAAAHRRLVLANLVRTVAWTLRGILVLLWFLAVL